LQHFYSRVVFLQIFFCKTIRFFAWSHAFLIECKLTLLVVALSIILLLKVEGAMYGMC
jgi:hypothetical protein